MGRRRKGKNKNIQNVRRTRPPFKQGEDDQVAKVPEWVIDMNKCLQEGADYDSGRSWTIYRVPASVQEIHRKSYLPKIISIGPFHYREKSLLCMDEHKMRYLLRLLGGRFQANNIRPEEDTNIDGNKIRSFDEVAEQVMIRSAKSKESAASSSSSPRITNIDDNKIRSFDEVVSQVMISSAKSKESTASSSSPRTTNIKLEDLASAMRALEDSARQCYSEAFDFIDSDDFVQMMVVDGCFVVELLRLYYKFDKGVTIGDDPIFTTRWMLRTLQRDMLMLENQLPFIVLEKLFYLTTSKDHDPSSPSLLDLIYTFFDHLLPSDGETPKFNPNETFDHMLDAFRSTYLTSVKGKMTEWSWKQLSLNSNSNSNITLVKERQLIHCVTELQEAGLVFRKKIGSSNNLLDIEFEKGVLQIPPLYIDDNTVPLFLNFVAYEQCVEEAEPFFTNYFMFFDSLINSSKDVEILHKNGIINHALGSDKDVASLINKLGREIVYDLDQCYLSKQMKGVNEFWKAYFAAKWHAWWSNLVYDYFSSPWTFLSLLAAIFLLVLTTLQTVYTLVPYYQSFLVQIS